MKLYRLQSFNGFDGLTLQEGDISSPGPREVLIQVQATSLNYRDIAIARGEYGGAQPKLGIIPLSDGAGNITAIGNEVAGFAVGDRVTAIFRQNWLGGPMPLRAVHGDLGGSRDGMLAQAVVLNEESIVKFPPHLSYSEAATLPCAAVTAWHAFHAGTASLAPGQTVLVLGSGGVAIFALQFAKRLGANVVAITSSEAKVDMLCSLGADVVINYAHKPDWQQQVLSMTNGIGVDRVIETGGAGTLERSLMSTAAHGRVILIGVLSGPARIDPAPILLKRIELIGISTGSRDMFEQMNRAIGQWQLHPVINHTFDFEDAKSAYDYLAGGNHIGKVIIAV